MYLVSNVLKCVMYTQEKLYVIYDWLDLDTY